MTEMHNTQLTCNFIEQPNSILKATWLHILFLFCLQPLSSQPFPALTFSHLTTKEGLSNNTINTIAQDRDGFTWVGTNDGLNRLDGYRIKKYFHQPGNNNTLVNNFINQSGIVVDNHNNIWIATSEGMSCYKKNNNEFINFVHEYGGGGNRNRDFFNAAYFDSAENKVWSCVNNSLIRFDENLHREEFAINRSGIAPLNSNANINLSRIFEDRQQQIWALYQNHIFLFNRKTKAIARSFYLGSGFAISMWQDMYNNYWIGTYAGGLYLFNPETASFRKVPLCGNALFIYDIKEWKDNHHMDWVALGTGNGLILLNPITQQSKLYAHDKENESAILPGDVNCIWADAKGLLWLGTANGISYVEPSKQMIEKWDITLPLEKQPAAVNDFAKCFLADSNGYWAGRWRRPGLVHYDSTGKIDRVCQFPSSLKGRSHGIYFIARLTNGHLLLSTEESIIEYDARRNRKLYETHLLNTVPEFRNMMPYDDSTWWVRTRNNGSNGIYVYNSHSHKITQHYYYRNDCSSCLPPDLFDILITKNKKIYTTPANNYLYEFDTSKNNFIPFFTAKQQTQNLPSSNFECLAEDPNGCLWVGTANGLIELNPQTKRMVSDYSTDKTIGGTEIENLCFDTYGNLWMNSERGIFCLNPKTKQVYNFNTGDGLASNSLPGFLCRSYDGSMFSGGLGYIIKFDPAGLLHHSSPSTTKIAEVTIMNVPHAIRGNTNNEKTISLEPGQTNFSVDFSVLNYDNASSNHYYYTLDGLMPEWRESDNGHLNFYNLRSGSYTLHVKGGDKYGNKFQEEDYLLIEVQPFWWQSKWFYAALGLLAVFSGFFFVRRRIKIIRRDASMKTKMAETEMMALRAQMNPHFIFNCMNIIDGFITSDRKEEAQDFLQKFSKLIRLVLENSQYQLVPLHQDLQAVKLYTELEVIRFNHHFKYEFDIDEDLLEENYKIPPLLLQPYVENAIVHGLRNKENNNGKLVVRIKKDKRNVIIEIEDNGIGRKRSMLLNEENKKNYQHLGMKVTAKRLALLQQINNNKICVSIDNLPGGNSDSGTNVTITLPEELKVEIK